MIKTTGITKSFGDLKVLKGIDIEIRDKEVIAIVGASGAGKTTLLQIIGTLDKPDNGTIYYNGTDISRMKGRSLASFRNSNIGFVFQFHQLLPEFTALENVCIPAYIAGKTKSEAEAKASELLGFLSLSDRLEHKPSELSGGEQQRVAVARALVNNPSVILADEPSGNLDSENKNELHKLFFRLRDTFGQTIVIVTHDRQLADMSDRI
ncbi:MAG: lipoprotein ABC transporter ATP-binding protein, partial [Bacteroidetes bacterium RBG_13_43_22]